MLISAMALTIAVSSCNIYKKYELPQNGIVGEYTQAAAQPADSSALGNLPWDKIFTDPILQGYIRLALENNLDLQNAKLNVDIAQAQLLGAKLSYLPSLAFAPNGSGSSLGGSKLSWGYQLPLSLSWEVDIFGRLTNSKRKAKAQLLQSEAYRQAVNSQIIGGVANTYYALVALNKQLAIYKETAEAWKQSVQVMKDMKEAGRFTEVSVVQSTANYHSVLAAIPNIEMSIHELNNTMSLLLNTPRSTWIVDCESMITLPAEISEEIPMSYLAQRPDVKAAEQAFAMAYYATNVARSNFYPSITLSATGGYGTLVGSAIIDPAQWLVNLAGQLTMPLFSRGKNIANMKAAKAQQQQSLNNFQTTLLSAGNEVSNALITITKTKEAGVNIEFQEENLKKAVEYNKDLLTLGTTTYLEVLTAQQQLLQSQIQVVNNKLSTNQAAINLYQALGGGR
ncbi:MAG: TolC family protein [Muribaculaceae bacterium]|nr:TolC family protein [Muribaculaceae bacterium]